MGYQVIKFFTDLQDNNHAYNVGDKFPRQGMRVKQERIDELMSNKNRQKTPLIADTKESLSEVKEEPQELKAGENTEEKPKAKKKARKTQEKV